MIGLNEEVKHQTASSNKLKLFIFIMQHLELKYKRFESPSTNHCDTWIGVHKYFLNTILKTVHLPVFIRVVQITFKQTSFTKQIHSIYFLIRW